jgi:hypothetical protein
VQAALALQKQLAPMAWTTGLQATMQQHAEKLLEVKSELEAQMAAQVVDASRVAQIMQAAASAQAACALDSARANKLINPSKPAGKAAAKRGAGRKGQPAAGEGASNE